MNFEIPPDLNPFVQQMITLGNYRNENEVILDGLRLLQSRERLRVDVDAGIEQLEARKGVDGAAVFDRLETRARQLDSSKVD